MINEVVNILTSVLNCLYCTLLSIMYYLYCPYCLYCLYCAYCVYCPYCLWCTICIVLSNKYIQSMHGRFAFKCDQCPTKCLFTDNLNKHIQRFGVRTMWHPDNVTPGHCDTWLFCHHKNKHRIKHNSLFHVLTPQASSVCSEL